MLGGITSLSIPLDSLPIKRVGQGDVVEASDATTRVNLMRRTSELPLCDKSPKRDEILHENVQEPHCAIH